jgi:phosphoglycolate phosphatase
MTLGDRILETVGPDGHVLWDWNGTLLDDVDHAVRTVNWLLGEQGLPSLDRERYRSVFGFPIRDYYVALGFDFERESFESLCERYVQRFMDGVLSVPLVNGMEAELRRLKSLGIRQSVLSAAEQADLDSMVRHFGLADVFERVYGIEDRLAASKVGRGRELLALLGARPERTVIVGDTLHDLEVAEALGIRAILVGHGHQCASRHPRV